MKPDKSDKTEHFQPIITPREPPCGFVNDENEKNERESTRQAKERFVAIFESVGGGSIGFVTQKAGISRDTFYRWLHEDKKFNEKIESIKNNLNDFVEDILMMKIEQGDGASVRFYLSRRHPKYKKQRQTYIYQAGAPQDNHTKTLEELLNSQ